MPLSESMTKCRCNSLKGWTHEKIGRYRKLVGQSSGARIEVRPNHPGTCKAKHMLYTKHNMSETHRYVAVPESNPYALCENRTPSTARPDSSRRTT